MRLGYSALALAVVAFSGGQAQLAATDSLGPYGRVVQSWIALRVAPGREAQAIERVRDTGEWSSGALGSLVRTRGEGSPHRVVACGLDETSYVVSDITDAGYLRVHTAGARALPPAWHQMHLGQRIVVLTYDRATTTRGRTVPGVFAVRSTHLWRGGQLTGDSSVTLEDLWVDVGARTRADVAALGIRVLDPVFRDMPDWSVGDAVVGPAAANRAGCAAVAAAAEHTPASGRTTFVVSTQSSFSWAGLSAVIARLGDVDEVFVASPDSQRVGRAIKVRSRFPGTVVETIAESDLRTLFDAVATAAGVRTRTSPAGARITSGAARPPQPTDSLTRYSELLARLTDTYSVWGDEEPTREVLRARLPAWARDSITTDSVGNMVLALGPDRDTVVFVAHMDEVGFEVLRVQSGVASLRLRGGFFPALWTSQPALLHLAGADRARGCRPTSGTALRGVFLPADSASRARREVQAWFGDQLAAAGVVTGLKVTGYKCATRLAGTRFTARAIDDRLGSAALVLALDGINPSALDHKVMFVWSVQEEGGHVGAHALASRIGTSVRRVHAIDTFVSADSPLETGRFAVVPIGSGAVLRALDNASVSPPEDIERVSRIARSAGVPLQVNLTMGATDGSDFVPFGAFNVALSWPLRYSHSPAELIDLRDMRSLVRLIIAVANAPVR